MKRVFKKITLKDDTFNDIKSGNVDTDLFIDRINGYVSKANRLINTKMENLDDVELLENLEEVFDIYFDRKDFLRMFALKYGNHYIDYMPIMTYMYDENGNNISYLAAVTNKVKLLDRRVFDLKTLRRLTNSGDILLLKKNVAKPIDSIRKREKYENLFVDGTDIDSGIVDKSSDLYSCAATIVRKKTIIKYVLYDLKMYISEINRQVKEIIALSMSDDEELSRIGKQYKESYDKNSNNGTLSKGERVSVKYHQKSNKRRRRN